MNPLDAFNEWDAERLDKSRAAQHAESLDDQHSHEPSTMSAPTTEPETKPDYGRIAFKALNPVSNWEIQGEAYQAGWYRVANAVIAAFCEANPPVTAEDLRQCMSFQSWLSDNRIEEIRNEINARLRSRAKVQQGSPKEAKAQPPTELSLNALSRANNEALKRDILASERTSETVDDVAYVGWHGDDKDLSELVVSADFAHSLAIQRNEARAEARNLFQQFHQLAGEILGPDVGCNVEDAVKKVREEREQLVAANVNVKKLDNLTNGLQAKCERLEKERDAAAGIANEKQKCLDEACEKLHQLSAKPASPWRDAKVDPPTAKNCGRPDGAILVDNIKINGEEFPETVCVGSVYAEEARFWMPIPPLPTPPAKEDDAISAKETPVWTAFVEHQKKYPKADWATFCQGYQAAMKGESHES